MEGRRPPNGERRRAVKELLEAGASQAEAARALGITPATVSYHARALGVPVRAKCARRHNWALIQEYHDAGHSMRQCQKRFGFSSKTWADAAARGAIKPRPAAAPIELYLVKGRNTSRTHLKRRLLAEGLKQNRCEICGLIEWLGRPLSMALHHINGDGRDNRLENLQLLCPNCHSQTDNFSGRKRARLRVVPDSADLVNPNLDVA
jgi:5-methylcytosine-specific restriction endonuclease McrA